MQNNQTDDAVLADSLGRVLSTLGGVPGAQGLSLARLSKRSAMPMSTLRRLLSALAEADLVVVHLEEDNGRGVARLTDAGRALCEISA